MPIVQCNQCGRNLFVSSQLLVEANRLLCAFCTAANSGLTNTPAPQEQEPSRPRRLCPQCKNPLKSTKRCASCRYCNTCCTCDMYCSDCRKVHAKGWKFCNYCRHCSMFCKCRKRPKFLSGLATREKNAPKLINDLGRSLSLEIEVANWGTYNSTIARLPESHKVLWQLNTSTAHDSSVTSGTELIVAPKAGDDFVKGVIQVATVLQQAGVKFDSTCGFHVHVNASDYNATAIKNILWLWRAYHPAMEGRLYSEERVNNAYCKETTRWLQDIFPLIEPVENPRILRAIFTWVCAVGSRYFAAMTDSRVAERHQTEAALNYPKIRELLTGVGPIDGYFIPKKLLINGIKYIIANQLTFPKDLIRKDGISVVRNHYNPIRYSSVNLASLWYRGSLEFRIKEATFALDELLMWPLFCGWLTEIAANTNFSTIKKITANKTLAEFVAYRTYQGRRLFPEAVETWVHSKLGVI